jgi:hypothetical protein
MCRPLTEAEISAIVEAGGGDILAFWARYLKKRNRSRTNVIAVIQGRPTLQKGLSGKAAIILAERGQSQPEAVVA